MVSSTIVHCYVLHARTDLQPYLHGLGGIRMSAVSILHHHHSPCIRTRSHKISSGSGPWHPPACNTSACCAHLSTGCSCGAGAEGHDRQRQPHAGARAGGAGGHSSSAGGPPALREPVPLERWHLPGLPSWGQVGQQQPSTGGPLPRGPGSVLPGGPSSRFSSPLVRTPLLAAQLVLCVHPFRSTLCCSTPKRALQRRCNKAGGGWMWAVFTLHHEGR
jgi:hypothetical protein